MKEQGPRRPAILYKYRSDDDQGWEYSRRHFSHFELYFASRKDLNDPFECRFTLSHEATNEQLRRYVERVLKRTPLNRDQRRKRAREIVRDRKRRLRKDFALVEDQMQSAIDRDLGIFCLARRNDHILMWSHYSGAHTGICLGFDTESEGSPFQMAEEVRYAGDYPVCRLITDDPMEAQAAAILTKADVWSYEEEWRLIDFANGPGVRNFDPRYLKEVVLGARISQTRSQEILELVEERFPEVSVLQARLKESAYALDLERLL